METSAFPASSIGVLHGIQEVVTVQAPAAGSEWSYTVPGGYYRRLIAASGTLTTSATVASRFPGVQVTDGQNQLASIFGVTAMTASLVVKFCVMASGQSNNTSAAVPCVTLGMPGMWLPPSYIYRSSTVNLQAADQWSAMVLWWECLDRNTLPHHEHEAMIEVENVNIHA